MTNVEKYLGNIAKKSGEDVDKLRQEYETILEQIPPGDKREEKALKELNKKYVADRSSAVMKEFIVVGIGALMDYTANRRKQILERYANDQVASMEAGEVKEIEGKIVPIDMKEYFDKANTMKNRNYGKELLPQHARGCLALIKEDEGDGYNMCSLTLRGKKAVGDLPPTNVLIKARLNGDGTKGYSTSEKATNYETISVISGDNLQSLLIKYAGDKFMELGDCFDYHQSLEEGSQEFYNRYVITSGQVVFFKEADEGKQSGYLRLDDISTTESIGCFVPNTISGLNQGQEISVIARTSISKGWDPEKRVNTDEDVVQLNVMGVIRL